MEFLFLSDRLSNDQKWLRKKDGIRTQSERAKNDRNDVGEKINKQQINFNCGTMESEREAGENQEERERERDRRRMRDNC
jgi:hypothetical protein